MHQKSSKKKEGSVDLYNLYQMHFLYKTAIPLFLRPILVRGLVPRFPNLSNNKLNKLFNKENCKTD